MKTVMKIAAALAFVLFSAMPALAQTPMAGDLPKGNLTIPSVLR